MPHIYSFFQTWFGPYEHIASALLVSVILISFSFVAKRRLAVAADPLVPDSKLSVRTMAELTVGSLRDFCRSILGPHGEIYIPLFGSLFIFIFINNALGLIPSFNPATGNVNTNAALAILVFFLTHYLGIKEHGKAYLKHFTGPVLFIAPLFVVIELIGHCVRPLTLTVRLFANMTVDHIVLSAFTDLTHIIVPVIFVGFGLFVCLVQAIVFTLLSMIYISMAISHDH